jgi:hypothetical protein
MRMIASKRRSSFGTNCVQCDNELIAPERSDLEAKNKKDEGGYNDVDGNPSFFELWNRMHSML